MDKSIYILCLYFYISFYSSLRRLNSCNQFKLFDFLFIVFVSAAIIPIYSLCFICYFGVNKYRILIRGMMKFHTFKSIYLWETACSLTHSLLYTKRLNSKSKCNLIDHITNWSLKWFPIETCVWISTRSWCPFVLTKFLHSHVQHDVESMITQKLIQPIHIHGSHSILPPFECVCVCVQNFNWLHA